MLHITTKLKRVKYSRIIFGVIISPITALLIALNLIGLALMYISEATAAAMKAPYFYVEKRLCKRFGWDYVARKRYAHKTRS